MRVGLGLPQLGPHVDQGCIRQFCERAEALGFASLWVQEHLFYPHDNRSGYAGRDNAQVNERYRSVLGPTELMAFAAACTSRMAIGSSILVAGYHRPIELAQRLSTLDVLSGGRLIAGLSVGWSDEEHQQMDVDPRTRGQRMDELMEALLACWGPDPVEFSGKFFTIPRSDVQPKPIQQPHPPLLSGLKTSPAGSRRTARYFDIWNPSRGTASELRHQVSALDADRPEGAHPIRLFVRTYTQRPTDRPGDPIAGIDGVRADLVAAIEAGAEELIVECGFWHEMDSPAAWAELPDRLADLVELAGPAR